MVSHDFPLNPMIFNQNSRFAGGTGMVREGAATGGTGRQHPGEITWHFWRNLTIFLFRAIMEVGTEHTGIQW